MGNLSVLGILFGIAFLIFVILPALTISAGG